MAAFAAMTEWRESVLTANEARAKLASERHGGSVERGGATSLILDDLANDTPIPNLSESKPNDFGTTSLFQTSRAAREIDWPSRTTRPRSLNRLMDALRVEAGRSSSNASARIEPVTRPLF